MCGRRRGRRRNVWRRAARCFSSGVADGAEGLVLADLARAVAAGDAAPAISLAVICRDGTAHGGAGAVAGLLRPRHRGAGIPGLGLPALRPRVAACRRSGAAHDDAGAARARQRPRAAGGPAHHRQRHPPARAAARDAWRAQSLVGGARQRARHVRRHPLARAQRLHPRRHRARGGRLRGARRHHRSVRARHGRAGAARLLRRHAGIDPRVRSGDASAPPTQLHALDLVPVAEFQLTTETIRRFRTGYVAAFGAADARRSAL